ncbi:type II toxin-antitoxin system RelE/ParE family toxin [Desulfosarcina sp. BuS5]|uniref:type II toxin-antitoxin system RelE/ParE family toxin n=1 Tax=Desulfosarcina sp. BuS5 TaxID=933262 RepID=UPI001E4418A3|nr:type II toxin-antitoxin system RelE/ParE family toxin [Desulfosarcina sp. BuS5]
MPKIHLLALKKKVILRGVFVHKFKIKTIQYLLSYRYIGDDLELIMIGPYENYYRDLKELPKSKIKGRTRQIQPTQKAARLIANGSRRLRLLESFAINAVS